jgi:pilus assembly protein Flp/PilA
MGRVAPTVTDGGIAPAFRGACARAGRNRTGFDEEERGCTQMLQLYTGLTTWWADLKERLSEDRGATAVEYALMVALIAVVVILAVTFLGESASEKFSEVGSAVDSAS